MGTKMTIPNLGDDGWGDLQDLIRSERLTYDSRRNREKWQFIFDQTLTAGQRTQFETLVTQTRSGVKFE